MDRRDGDPADGSTRPRRGGSESPRRGGSNSPRRDDESALIDMYRSHPCPRSRRKLEFADRRMELRLHCCGIGPEDYVGKKVLDAGCGTGEYACWFASQGARVTGIDLSDAALEEAEEYARTEGIEGVRFEERSVLDTGFEDAAFDLVYCTGVLHHTPAPFDGLRELCRVTRPGGRVLVSLYHSFGFLPRLVRWRVAKALGGDDLDRRVEWGSRLFPRMSRKLREERETDPQTDLYDYFAAPLQSTHGIGQVLDWFDRVGLEHTGSLPPARVADYPRLFRHELYASADEEVQSPAHGLIARLGSSDELEGGRPGPLERFLVQVLWLFAGVEIFSVGGKKALEDEYFVQ